MKRVLILYKFLPQYRSDFFQQLRDQLAKDNIQLDLVYGKLKNTDSLKKDEVHLDWATYVSNKVINLGSSQLIWQPCIKYLKGKDLVIVEQANKLLFNYYLMYARKFSHFKFANWGHGRNMQDDPESRMNKFKYRFIKKCDWWFAYTEGVKQFLIEQKYPSEKITVVQNAIDTVSLRKYYSEIEDSVINKLKQETGIKSENVGIYCGGMYAEKKLDFILEVCKKVRVQIPDFNMIFIGSGIDAPKVEKASKEYSWIHYPGSKFGNDRVGYFKLASIQLMPGLVGLGILDSFALETPIMTTKYPFHSPEIEYLKDGENGIITEDTFDDYVNRVIQVLKDKEYRKLIDGCANSAKIYTVEAMVDNFKNGIIKCLSY